MRLALTIVLGGGLLAGTAHSDDLGVGDRSAGRTLAGMCRTCHGLEGLARIPIAPNIGGEPVEYLRAQLLAFREGSREHEMMTVVAASLSDQDIDDLAAWYSGHQIDAALPQDANPDDAPIACLSCHGIAGLSDLPDAPHLAGETNIYIETQLKAFRSGKRQHEVMSAIAQSLSDAEMRAIADWYASASIDITLTE